MLARAAAVLTLGLLAPAAGARETRMVPVTLDGARVRLEMRIDQSSAPGPAPTLVFNHGSIGSGTNPDAFTRPLDFPTVARFFVERGWAVVIPARRGRGGSEGQYDEGFATNRASGYACDPLLSIAGADRALRDVEAAMDTILAMPFGGRHPEQVKGVINFVGGWNGARCGHASTINQALFTRGASYPGDTIWLYGDGDVFYPLSHSRANFAAFQAAGGQGAFHELPREAGGHWVWRHPEKP